MTLRTPSKRLRKAYERFRNAVTKLLESLGVRPGRFYDLELDAPAGLLHITVYENWVATRFDNLTLGRAFTNSCGRACNPYSGKWNFHYCDSLDPQVVVADLRYWLGLLMEWKPEVTEFGIVLDSGDFLERPQRHGGEIRRIDRRGNCVEARKHPSPEWWEWYRLFEKADLLSRFFIGQTVVLPEGSTGTIFDIADSDGENAEACVLPQETWIPLENLRPCR